MVGDTGIEPVTSSVSGKRSPAELIAPHHSSGPDEMAFLRGGNGIRTRVHGFAGRCLASRPSHRGGPPGVAWTSSSGRRDSNPRPSPWQGDALPTALRPLSCAARFGLRRLGNCIRTRRALQTGTASATFTATGRPHEPEPSIRLRRGRERPPNPSMGPVLPARWRFRTGWRRRLMACNHFGRRGSGRSGWNGSGFERVVQRDGAGNRGKTLVQVVVVHLGAERDDLQGPIGECGQVRDVRQ